jgi:hypothetical protein
MSGALVSSDAIAIPHYETLIIDVGAAHSILRKLFPHREKPHASD